jgi:hypothetical protein
MMIPEETSAPPFCGKRALIICGNETLAQVISKQLTSLGLVPFSTTSPTHALQVLQNLYQKSSSDLSESDAQQNEGMMPQTTVIPALDDPPITSYQMIRRLSKENFPEFFQEAKQSVRQSEEWEQQGADVVIIDAKEDFTIIQQLNKLTKVIVSG